MFDRMKGIISLFVMVLMVTVLTACSGGSKTQTSEAPAVSESQKETEESTAEAETEAAPEESVQEAEESAEGSSSESKAEAETTEPAPAAHSDVLVVYFSATGTTKGVAERIAGVTGGDLYEILAAEPYSEADLNYNDRDSRSTKEQDDKSARPEISSEDISLEGYTTLYIGFPIWWGEEPRIMDTFVEKYSFEGITVIPFCTSASSGIGHSGPNMEALARSGTWLDGERFSGNVSEDDLRAWIESLS